MSDTNKQTDGLAGSDAPTCSPSSLTPETDDYLRNRCHLIARGCVRDFAGHLEQERNKMTAVASDFAAELREVRTAIRALAAAKGRYHTQKAFERLISLLPENTPDRPS